MNSSGNSSGNSGGNSIDDKIKLFNFELPNPTKRTCIVCGKDFEGIREFCNEEKCYYGWKIIVKERKEYMHYMYGWPMFDYISTPRKTMIFTLQDYLDGYEQEK